MSQMRPAPMLQDTLLMGGLSLPYRRLIFERDAFTCAYCGRQLPTTDLEIDHVIPRSMGGTSASENLVTACRSCNNRKSDNAVALPVGTTIQPVPRLLGRRIRHLLALEAAASGEATE